jgi:hypothetical protein
MMTKAQLLGAEQLASTRSLLHVVAIGGRYHLALLEAVLAERLSPPLSGAFPAPRPPVQARGSPGRVIFLGVYLAPATTDGGTRTAGHRAGRRRADGHQ